MAIKHIKRMPFAVESRLDDGHNSRVVVDCSTRICFKFGKREIPFSTITLPLFLISQDLRTAKWACRTMKNRFYWLLFNLYLLDVEEAERMSLSKFSLNIRMTRRKRKNAEFISKSAIGRAIARENSSKIDTNEFCARIPR